MPRLEQHHDPSRLEMACVTLCWFAPVRKKLAQHECNMGQPPSIIFDLIQDPETGLALLAKRSGKQTPEQERERQFWQLQFTNLRDWQQGDVLAVSRAMTDCSIFNRPPPFWLLKANSDLCVQHMTDAEKRARGDMNTHWLRWKAVKLVRGRHPNDPRNFKRGVVRGEAVWEEAAKLLAGTNAECDEETVRKSYALIRRAGGTHVTLPSYKREVKARDRRRKKK
jgi:hypothetical protein